MSNFIRATDYLRGYMKHKRDSEALRVRPMWFSSYQRFGTGDTVIPENYEALVALADPAPDDDEALNYYRKLKDLNIESEDVPEGGDRQTVLATRVRVLASLNQAVRRQFIRKQPIDAHRAEYEAKIPVSALIASASDTFKPEDA